MANDHIYADGITAVQLTNGNLRIHLVQRGADEGQTVPAGTLIIPAGRARALMTGLNQSLSRIIEEMRKRGEGGKGAGEAENLDTVTSKPEV